MHRIPDQLARLARWPVVVGVQLANVASFQLLFWLDARFTALTGRPVFNTQNELTAQGMREQLPAYIGAARTAYYAFAAYDFVFPALASLSLVLLCAALLRYNTFAFARRLLALGLPLLFFASALFDWGENVGMLTVLASTAPTDAEIAGALLFKRLKLLSLGVSGAFIATVFLFALTNWGLRLVRRMRS